MVKHIQTIRRLLPTNCLCVFDHFLRLSLEGLMITWNIFNLLGVLLFWLETCICNPLPKLLIFNRFFHLLLYQSRSWLFSNFRLKPFFITQRQHEILTYFWPMFPFYTPWKHQKILSFLVFSGGIKWDHWPEMD